MEPILPWYIAGPLLGLIIPVLLILKEKQFGVSSSLRVMGSFILPKTNYFTYKREADYWQVFFAIGLIAVGIVFNWFGLVESTNQQINSSLKPVTTSIYSSSNALVFGIGGLLLGFGARYAGGCTAGHCIMGNSLIAKSSMISTGSFFIGGLLTSNFLIPLIF